MYMVDNNKLYFQFLRNRPEKIEKGLIFYLFQKLVQINYIFSDNIQ
jgi:hypothetical protein